MRKLVVVAQLFMALFASSASAAPGTFPHGTVDQTFTTKKPNSPTGGSFSGVYHAANDPDGNPPYMRKMTFYPPRGMRYDTSVPDRCTASDIELQVNGPAACPKGSRIGGGTTEGIFYEPIANAFVFTTYKNPFDMFNNTNEQVMVIGSGGFGYTVVRGRIGPDQSITYESPTCFPAPPAGQKCARDHVLQTKSNSFMPRYAKRLQGRLRGYATTPPTCPRRGYWRTTIRFWWADGSIDDAITTQPCTGPYRSR